MRVISKMFLVGLFIEICRETSIRIHTLVASLILLILFWFLLIYTEFAFATNTLDSVISYSFHSNGHIYNL